MDAAPESSASDAAHSQASAWVPGQGHHLDGQQRARPACQGLWLFPFAVRVLISSQAPPVEAERYVAVPRCAACKALRKTTLKSRSALLVWNECKI